MTMNPRRFLALALRLIQTERTPEGLRTAVSRAYYAAFHAAAGLLRQVGVPVSGGARGHGDVRSKLVSSGDDALIDAGIRLSALHGERVKADYHLDQETIEREPIASVLVNQASEIIKAIDTCGRSPERCRRIGEAIKQWLASLGLSPPQTRAGESSP